MDLLNPKFIFEGVVLSIVGLLGTVGNAAAILYFGKSQRCKQTFYGLMLVLAIFDLLLIISMFCIFSLPQFSDSDTYKSSHLWYFQIMVWVWVLPVAHICATGSTYLTVAVSVERYLAICRPLYHRTHSWPTHFFVIPILSFSIFYNVPKFFEMESTTTLEEKNGTNMSFPQIKLTELRANPYYYQMYSLCSNFIINGIIPFALLIVLNVLITKKLRKYQSRSIIRRRTPENQMSHPRIHRQGEGQRRQVQVHMAKVSIIIVVIFIICHSFKWVANIYELICVSSKLNNHLIQ